MKLYHFMAPQHVLGAILRNLLKLSTIDSLNDPYEMLPDIVDTDGGHAPICLVRERMMQVLKNTGMICLSKAASSPAMWAHYANKHQGVALEFTFTRAQMPGLFEVKYMNNRVVIRPEDNFSNRVTRDVVFERMIKTKATPWQYEQEYRYVFSLHDKHVVMDDQGLFYRRFPQELRRVILGIDCQLNASAIRKALDASGFNTVGVATARMSDTCFRIVIPSVSAPAKGGTYLEGC